MAVAVGREFRTASHGVWGVLVGRDEFVGIGGYADASDRKQQGRCHKEAFQVGAPILVYAKTYQKAYGIYENHYCQIICNLNMVGLYLEAEGKGEKDGAQNGQRKPAS